MAQNVSPEKQTFRYFNRELSWLAFNRRVLNQAQSSDYPLLERMKFLAFVSSNLDEFFEIRVAGLIQQIKSGIVECGPDGLDPNQQLIHIQSTVKELLLEQNQCWKNCNHFRSLVGLCHLCVSFMVHRVNIFGMILKKILIWFLKKKKGSRRMR